MIKNGLWAEPVLSVSQMTRLVDLSEIPEDDNGLYYKDEPYTPHTLHQRLIVTYSPKYARYQKMIRDAQNGTC